MKTPRNILLKRHQATGPKLDEIREKVVTTIGDARTSNLPAVTTSRYHLRDFIYSLRWQLAGMGAAWLLILLLNLDFGNSADLASAAPRKNILPEQILLASLRENRRELLELIQPAEAREAQAPKLFPPRPRSEGQCETLKS